ncbi:Cytochrome P450 3A28 [Monoraphidium neglectum]|uniref:Cytochrome P450 3A28 n=1 Tax=Monoraphidium neglectum TaxID=145388 RepID=A0A0D2MTW0_9CHLO|nr:Cytochrome P450 3A28 [Monoraphidium neglectum]KIY97875.1 Cytochrome P450 3A28 [Monoraphidium neglectum]|eukprot:XP_013896895.1 Cytochrome P450 3A28 [Monoraphidium neglectum]
MSRPTQTREQVGPGFSPRELVLDDLKRLPYLSSALKEAMRMLPVVSIMGRVAERTVKVGPYTVPPGTIVATPLFAIHNTKHNWDAPEEYRPERWESVPVETYVWDGREGASAAGSGAGSGDTRSGGGDSRGGAAGGPTCARRGITFMPFSEGPRNCVGQSLAKMEVMALLAKLLASFQIELAPEMGGREGVRGRESTHLTLQTAGTKGIRCRLRPRSDAVGAGRASAGAPAGA